MLADETVNRKKEGITPSACDLDCSEISVIVLVVALLLQSSSRCRESHASEDQAGTHKFANPNPEVPKRISAWVTVIADPITVLNTQFQALIPSVWPALVQKKTKKYTQTTTK